MCFFNFCSVISVLSKKRCPQQFKVSNILSLAINGVFTNSVVSVSSGGSVSSGCCYCLSFPSLLSDENGRDKTPKHQLCCSCCNPQIDPVVFPTLYFFSPVCYCRPMGSKSWVSGIPKEERRPVFGTRQYTKFFLSSQNFSPPFSLHSLSLSFSFCVCVCPRPVSVYSDGKRRLSFATLVNDSFSFSLCPSYTFSHRLR